MSDVDPTTQSIHVKLIDVKDNHLKTVPVVISNDTKVKNIINQLNPDFSNQWDLYEEKGTKKVPDLSQ